ncbi:MAG TPA: hypothetical protein VG298_13065 [Acidimicrobiales bacterium]|nr:hypothetical protein [Acidimicrobiales bacterium]
MATAYRYFRTAEDLWEEAALFDSTLLIDPEAVEAAIEAAGDDVEARLDVVVRQLGWAFIDHEPVSRQIMKTSLDRWFTSQTESLDARPVRPGIRNQWNALVVRPLRGTLRDDRLDEVVDALGLVLGTETVLTLVDVLHLSPEAAKDRLLITARWILRSGLAEAARP